MALLPPAYAAPPFLAHSRTFCLVLYRWYRSHALASASAIFLALFIAAIRCAFFLRLMYARYPAAELFLSCFWK